MVRRREVLQGLACLVLVGGHAGVPVGSARSLGAEATVFGTQTTHAVAPGESLAAIAVHHGFGFTEIVAANPDLPPWYPPVGADAVLPGHHILPDGPRAGLLLNLGQQRLFRFDTLGRPAASYAVGIGQAGWETPTGRTVVIDKRRDPVWIPPPSIRAEHPDLPSVVGPGPNNPLGRHALYLAWPRFLIHGTDRPYSIGRRATHGCVRLFEPDIAALFQMVDVGTPLTVVHQTELIAWADGRLLLECHPTPAQADEIDRTGQMTPGALDGDLTARIRLVADGAAAFVNWDRVRWEAAVRRGMPADILAGG